MSVDKEPWEEYPDVWKNKSSFFTWLRGAFRKAIWNRYPGKIIFKNGQAYPPPTGYTGKAKRLGKCGLTGDEQAISKMEVDHIKGNVSLNGWDDVETFVKHLCATESNMMLVTKDAHKIKSYAERAGISFEEAIVAKDVIAFGKLTNEQQIDKLMKIVGNNKEDTPSTKVGRKRMYESYMKGESDGST